MRTMNKNPRPKKRISYWRALVVGILVPFIGVNLFTIVATSGIFTSWETLKGPPTGVAQIVTIWWNALGKTWVKANDGTYYSKQILSYSASGTDARSIRDRQVRFSAWEPVRDISPIPEEEILRGRNCPSLKTGIFPFDPAGGVRECFYFYRDGDGGGDLYVALMADGSLKYWQNQRDRSLWVHSCFVSIALSLIVAVIISCIFAGICHKFDYASWPVPSSITQRGNQPE